MNTKLLIALCMVVLCSAPVQAESVIDENKTIYLGDGLTFNPGRVEDVARLALAEVCELRELQKRVEMLEEKVTHLMNTLKLKQGVIKEVNHAGRPN